VPVQMEPAGDVDGTTKAGNVETAVGVPPSVESRLPADNSRRVTTMRTMPFSSSDPLSSNRVSIAEPGACDEWRAGARAVELPDYG
jgi:hypothetical protein